MKKYEKNKLDRAFFLCYNNSANEKIIFKGVSPSGKAKDFDSFIRWFKSSYPCQQKTHFCLVTKVRFLNDVCLRQMMTASPNDVRYANDVCLRAHRGKHRIIATVGSNIILSEAKNIISPQAVLHCYSWTDSNRHTGCGEFPKAYQFKIYLQSCRCNGILNRFGLTKHLKCLQSWGIM